MMLISEIEEEPHPVDPDNRSVMLYARNRCISITVIPNGPWNSIRMQTWARQQGANNAFTTVAAGYGMVSPAAAAAAAASSDGLALASPPSNHASRNTGIQPMIMTMTLTLMHPNSSPSNQNHPPPQTDHPHSHQTILSPNEATNYEWQCGECGVRNLRSQDYWEHCLTGEHLERTKKQQVKQATNPSASATIIQHHQEEVCQHILHQNQNQNISNEAIEEETNLVHNRFSVASLAKETAARSSVNSNDDEQEADAGRNVTMQDTTTNISPPHQPADKPMTNVDTELHSKHQPHAIREDDEGASTKHSTTKLVTTNGWQKTPQKNDSYDSTSVVTPNGEKTISVESVAEDSSTSSSTTSEESAPNGSKSEDSEDDMFDGRSVLQTPSPVSKRNTFGAAPESMAGVPSIILFHKEEDAAIWDDSLRKTIDLRRSSSMDDSFFTPLQDLSQRHGTVLSNYPPTKKLLSSFDNNDDNENDDEEEDFLLLFSKPNDN